VNTVRVIHGDCIEAMRQLARDGVLVDSVCTDPPYHLASIVARFGGSDAAPAQVGATGAYARASAGFMGEEWDGGDIAFQVDTWRRVYDVMKPGAHLVAFAATKGYHRMACAIEDAGFEIRDMLGWLYATGFPKSHKIPTDDGVMGTALKPAIEPIVFAQKPISESSIAANVVRWGVGAINIDLCRIAIEAGEDFDGGGQNRNGVNVGTHHAGWRRPWMSDPEAIAAHRDRLQAGVEKARKLGRFPANVLHDGSAEVLEYFAGFGDRGAAAPVAERGTDKFGSIYGVCKGNGDNGATFQGDSGTAARFYFSSKATQGERIFECRICGVHTLGKTACGHEEEVLANDQPAIRTHPTVKPLSLVRWLVELITPPGGLVLDPFAGTGTTAAAARDAGMPSLSIEFKEAHVRDIGVRLGLDVSDIITAEVAALPVNHGKQRDMFL
jgi:site-specific DNA-methyltransferase (adenine-specific)